METYIQTTLQLQIVFRGDVAGRGDTPGGIFFSQDAESVLCVHVVDVHDVFYM
jgi:hypothetical protein